MDYPGLGLCSQEEGFRTLLINTHMICNRKLEMCFFINFKISLEKPRFAKITMKFLIPDYVQQNAFAPNNRLEFLKM